MDALQTMAQKIAWLERRIATLETREHRSTFGRNVLGPVAYEHFRGIDAIPSGFAWDTTTFGQPSNIDYSQADDYGVFYDGASPGFMRKVVSTYLGRSVYARCGAAEGGSAGLRIDDGTNNNYTELFVYVTSAGKDVIRLKYRTGGGAVSTVDGPTVPGGQFWSFRLLCAQSGVNHQDYGYLVTENGFNSVPIGSTGSASAWAVTRVGLLTNRDALGGRCMFDWFYKTMA